MWNRRGNRLGKRDEASVYSELSNWDWLTIPTWGWGIERGVFVSQL